MQVAIIRPGPIQGDAVNPYLRRRQGLEPVTYLHPSLEPILAETMGVVLYQEQILRIVMEVAGYTAGQADRFRRAMNRHRSRVEMEELRDEFVSRCGAVSGMPVAVAEQIFKSVAGFAQFGFCKSHAAAFARTAYETAWLRLHFPAEYVCALLNAQPMGFYHPSVLVEDAKRHGVRFLAVDVARSRARCTMEDGAVRLGFNYMKALGPAARLACEEAALAGATSLRDFWRHTLLPRRAMENLVLAGAFDAVEPGRHRRELLWELKQVEESLPPRTAARRAVDAQAAPSAATPAARPGRARRQPPRRRRPGARAGSRPTRFPRSSSCRPHRPRCRRWTSAPASSPSTRSARSARAGTCSRSSAPSSSRWDAGRWRTIRDLADGTRVRVAGLVIARQAPASASGFRFFTLADEDAHLDLIFRPDVVNRTRRVANHNPLLMVEGRLQNERGRVNLVVETVTALDGDGAPLPADTPVHRRRATVARLPLSAVSGAVRASPVPLPAHPYGADDGGDHHHDDHDDDDDREAAARAARAVARRAALRHQREQAEGRRVHLVGGAAAAGHALGRRAPPRAVEVLHLELRPAGPGGAEDDGHQVSGLHLHLLAAGGPRSRRRCRRRSRRRA